MTTATTIRRVALGALTVVALSAGVARAEDKVIMRINFTPWAMHAQYYAGVAQGIYKAEGIDLEIRPPSAGPQNEVVIGPRPEQICGAKPGGLIRARARGIPVIPR